MTATSQLVHFVPPPDTAPAKTSVSLPRGSTAHRNDIQGLRAVAVLLVAASHAGVSFLKGGYVGVDVFFVLSGFLITRLLLARAFKRGGVSLKDFYVRRARRILPAATLTLLVTDLFAYQFLNFVRAREVMLDSIWSSLFASNVYFGHEGTNYFAQNQPPSPVQHYWSLAVEEQFYLVWPALLSLALFAAFTRRSSRHSGMVTRRGIQRLFAGVVVLGLASLLWSVHGTAVDQKGAYFSTFTRAWELAVGAALAIGTLGILREPKQRQAARFGSTALRTLIGWIGIGAIGLAAVAFSADTAFPGYAALLPTLGAALIIAAGAGSRDSRFGVGRLLSLAPMRYVGDRSYAFYLWHWPVLVLASLYLGHSLSLHQNLLLVAGAFLLSIVSYRFVENPIHRAEWSPGASLVLWPASCAAVILLAGFAVSSLDQKAVSAEAASIVLTAPSAQSSAKSRLANRQAVAASLSGRPLPAVVAAVSAAERGAALPTGLSPPPGELLNSSYAWPPACSAHDGQTSNELCHFGRTSSTKSIVLFGDSHAEMWMPAIVSMAEKDGWNIVPLSKSACTPQKWNDGHNWAECHAWYRWAVERARALRPEVMLITGCCGAFTGDDAETVKESFLGLADSMKRYARNVVIIGDDTGVTQQPVDCLLRRHATMRTCTALWSDESFFLGQDLGALTKRRDLGFVDTSGWFCFHNRCPMVVGRTIVYADTGHITDQYARILAAPFRAAFRQAIRRSATEG